jgi:hypothetical protein
MTNKCMIYPSSLKCSSGIYTETKYSRIRKTYKLSNIISNDVLLHVVSKNRKYRNTLYKKERNWLNNSISRVKILKRRLLLTYKMEA